jgi:phosphoketolase
MKVPSGIPWRRKIASLNYLLASHAWRLRIRVINVVDLMDVIDRVPARGTPGMDMPEVREWRWGKP